MRACFRDALMGVTESCPTMLTCNASFKNGEMACVCVVYMYKSFWFGAREQLFNSLLSLMLCHFKLINEVHVFYSR